MSAVSGADSNKVLVRTPAVQCVMPPNFVFRENPSSDLRARIAACTDWPTVWCEPFLRSGAGANATVVALTVEANGQPLAVAFGTLNRRFLKSSLRLVSYPRFMDTSPTVDRVFWDGLSGYCRLRRVQTLLVQSFESMSELDSSPPLGAPESEQPRLEYVVDLRDGADAAFERFSSNHRRNIRRALARQPQLIVSRDPRELPSHFRAVAQTTDRREERGEAAAGVNEVLCHALLSSGDGYLAQLHLDGAVLSSFLIVRTPKRAFYFSGGTSKVGMQMGASHALMWMVIQDLCALGVERLTLGGAADGGAVGLNRYKLGFGAEEVRTTTRSFEVGGRAATAIARMPGRARRLGSRIRSMLARALPRLRRWVVYAWDRVDCPPETSSDDGEISIRPLEKVDFEGMLTRDDRFGEQARLYYRDRHVLSAFGAFSGSSLVHVTWCFTRESYANSPTRELRLEPGEVELTNCYTAPAFRGKNIYPLVIRRASRALFDQGAPCIYMKTEPRNEASQRGIAKAGLRRMGTLTHFSVPFLSRWDGVYYLTRDH